MAHCCQNVVVFFQSLSGDCVDKQMVQLQDSNQQQRCEIQIVLEHPSEYLSQNKKVVDNKKMAFC